MTRRLLLSLFVLFLLPSYSYPASKFWVGGTGALDGSTTTHISDTTGGAGGAVYPGAGDTLIFDAASGGGTVTFTAAASFAAITSGAHTGTIDTNGQTVALSGAWNLSGTGTRTLTLGASAITVQSWNATVVTNLTFNPNTSTITQNGTSQSFIGGSLTYNNVVLAGTTTVTGRVLGTNTFANLTKTGAATKVDTLTLDDGQTITGVLTINGNSDVNRVIVQSFVKGTAKTLTAATVSVTNADFQDITGAGAGSWDLSAITGGSGDAGGNSGITFTTADDNFWIGDTGNWSDATQWSQTTGGAANGRVPLPQDAAIFDANSFSTGSLTVTQDMPRICSVNWTGATNTPTWTTSTAASFFGSITLISGMTLTASTQAYTYEGRGASTLTSAGNTWGKAFLITAPGGTLTTQDATTFSGAAYFTLTHGTLNTSGGNVTAFAFVSTGTATRALVMGSETWSLSITSGAFWNIQSGTGFTLTSGTSTIKAVGALTGAVSMRGGAKTYYRLEEATTNAFALQLLDGNTFTNGIYIDASAAARTVQFTAGTTTTVGRIGRLDSTTNVITIGSVTAAGHTLARVSGGAFKTVLANASISRSTATAGAFYAPGGTDGGFNAGWAFTAAPGSFLSIQ